jgi:hypothetical protein
MSWAVGRLIAGVSDESPEKTFTATNMISAIATMNRNPRIKIVNALLPPFDESSGDVNVFTILGAD